MTVTAQTTSRCTSRFRTGSGTGSLIDADRSANDEDLPNVAIDVLQPLMPKAYLARPADLAPDHVAVTAFPRLQALDGDARWSA